MRSVAMLRSASRRVPRLGMLRSMSSAPVATEVRLTHAVNTRVPLRLASRRLRVLRR